jgi:hypothetical protein
MIFLNLRKIKEKLDWDNLGFSKGNKKVSTHSVDLESNGQPSLARE